MNHSIRETIEAFDDPTGTLEEYREDIIHDVELDIRSVVDQECGTLEENRELGLRIMKRLGIDPHGPLHRS